MSDDTNKLAEKLAGMPVQWWNSAWKAVVIVQRAELSEEGFVKARESAGKELARLLGLASIGLTVSDDAGVKTLRDAFRSPQPAPSTDDHPEPTAETRGDTEVVFGPKEPDEREMASRGSELGKFVKWWSTYNGSTHDVYATAAAAFYAGRRADRADLLAKVAGVRAELEAEKKTFCDAKHSDYHTGVVWGFVRSVRTLDAAFPSDPGEVKP